MQVREGILAKVADQEQYALQFLEADDAVEAAKCVVRAAALRDALNVVEAVRRRWKDAE